MAKKRHTCATTTKVTHALGRRLVTVFVWVMHVLIVSIAPLLGFSCEGISGSDAAESSNARSVEDATWILERIVSSEGRTLPLGSETIHVSFGSGEMSGVAEWVGRDRTGNSFSGAYRIKGDSLAIEAIESTKMGSPDGSNYWSLLQALESSHEHRIVGSTLTIIVDDLYHELRFRARLED